MFRISALHQIEMTSRCNLRCRYCVHPNLGRPKMDMSEAHYLLSLKWARMFVQAYGQRELNLAGIGESTMHPEFVRYTYLAREAVGASCTLVLATNGVSVTDEMVKAIAPTGIHLYVSMHRPEKAGPAIEIARKYGLLRGASSDPSLAAINWAGQVKWHVSVARRPCMWVRGGRVMVMADGRVTRCCLDSAGQSVICTIEDDLRKHATSAYGLCRTCDQDVGVPIPDEEAAHA